MQKEEVKKACKNFFEYGFGSPLTPEVEETFEKIWGKLEVKPDTNIESNKYRCEECGEIDFKVLENEDENGELLCKKYYKLRKEKVDTNIEEGAYPKGKVEETGIEIETNPIVDILINDFIKSRIPEWFGNLVDNDDNNGQRLRIELSRLLENATSPIPRVPSEFTKEYGLNELKFVFYITSEFDDGRCTKETMPMTLGEIIEGFQVDFIDGGYVNWNDLDWEETEIKVKILN